MTNIHFSSPLLIPQTLADQATLYSLKRYGQKISRKKYITTFLFLFLVNCSSATPCLEEAGSCTKWTDCYTHPSYGPDLICRTGCDGAQFGPSDRCCKDGHRCNGAIDDCCSKATPCDLGDGDCDEDNQCLGSLVCGSSNCDSSRVAYGGADDCCENP